MAPAGRGGRNDALDGLRLVAVAAVMAFHFGLPHAAGGFLGVDLFFVLSGYLITSLLLGQVVDGRVDLPGFWARRLRRLIPGLLALMVVVVAWGALAAPSVLRDHLRGDITATLFYVANWHFVSASSYFASDGTQSPLEHMWSLAVEEQFYLVWPILLALVAVAARQPRGRRIAVAVLAGTGFAVSLARLATLWSASGSDRAYFGTDSRIFEPLAGALLALLVTSPRPRAALVRSHWLLLALGAVGLGWGFATLGRTTGATTAYADGGALVVALSAAAVIAATSTRDSRATRILALPAVAYLGRLSYAMYLWHWPLQVWTERGGWWNLSGLALPARVAILTGLTVGLAALSYHLVEQPVRYGRLSRNLALDGR